MCKCAANLSRRVRCYSIVGAHLQPATFSLSWHLCLGILLTQRTMILRASIAI